MVARNIHKIVGKKGLFALIIMIYFTVTSQPFDGISIFTKESKKTLHQNSKELRAILRPDKKDNATSSINADVASAGRCSGSSSPGKLKCSQTKSTPWQWSVKPCNETTFHLWYPKMAVDTIRHIYSNGSKPVMRFDEIITHYKQSAWNDTCRDYYQAGVLPRFVLPNLCTSCGVRKDLVTLAVPMTDWDQMWPKLGLHAGRWNGPISVALMLTPSWWPDQKSFPTLIAVQALLTERMERFFRNIPSQLCFHLVLQKSQTPGNLFAINTLRNVASHFAATDFVLTIEADLMTPVNMSEQIARHPSIANSQGKTHRVAHVLHLFHFFNLKKNVSHVPQTKVQLLDMWRKGIVNSMGLERKGGHIRSNDSAFQASDQPYKIDYIQGYEPYYVVERALNPYYPEELLFGSQDKAAHTTLLNDIGFIFQSLNPLFVLHPDHSHQSRSLRPNRVYTCGGNRFLGILQKHILKFMDPAMHQSNTSSSHVT